MLAKWHCYCNYVLIKEHITLRNAHITAQNIVTNGVPYDRSAQVDLILRSTYCRNRLTGSFVTFGVTYGCVHRVMPMMVSEVSSAKQELLGLCRKDVASQTGGGWIPFR